MLNDSEIAETLPAFFAKLAEVLKTQSGVDAALAEIVSHNLLTAAPAADCIADAFRAIEALAAKRATSQRGTLDG